MRFLKQGLPFPCLPQLQLFSALLQAVCLFSNEFLCGDIAVANGLIAGVGKYDGKTEIDVSGKLVLPGFIDAHIHLESSMVTPAEFAKAVVAHGTTTVITDPHEITNVMGIDGVEYMIQA